jgi:hypothetical protein
LKTGFEGGKRNELFAKGFKISDSNILGTFDCCLFVGWALPHVLQEAYTHAHLATDETLRFDILSLKDCNVSI